ncbi:SUMF1/EgtB/PvdO family nonheme iron enzyme [Akkermansiaceae bacterium]|nr:SUMF1/EgtB/PvdO family nonheme iron enzyme [Akkermansiaceae bacterium]
MKKSCMPESKPLRQVFSALFCAALAGSIPTAAQAADPYSGMLEALRSEISAKLPRFNDASRAGIEGAKDSKARVEAARKLPELDKFLASDALDAKLAKFVILHEATPAGLAEFAAKGAEQRRSIDALLADDQLMLQMAIADGARPVHGRDSEPANYGRAMGIYTAIQKASPKAKEGVLQRLALAVSLEFSEPLGNDGTEDAPAKPDPIDPVKRYLHFEKAYQAGELDANFDRLGIWDLRFVVCAPEGDEALAWGREMLRNYRPDHIFTENEGWRYANLVNTDVRYGSIDVGKDRPELMGPQNILMNGGICGRRSFFARFICRAFGIPATARPSTGHGASARWTPQGWVVVLGPGWGSGKSTTRYRTDRDFLATTQARARANEFLKVKRAYWIGDAMGEKSCYTEFDPKAAPAFWNAVALATQRSIIEKSGAVTPDAVGADLGEADGKSDAGESKPIPPDARQITRGEDGTITIPAAACAQATGDSEDVIAMESFGGGMQVFLPRFLQQKPILVRGGSLRHEASLCESATRHWRGARPKKSKDLRGFRVAVTPDGERAEKEFAVELADGVAMEFVYIPPGRFLMGGDLREKQGDVLANTPRHDVTLTKGFYLGRYEVTQAQYEAVMGKAQGSMGSGPDYPADGVKPYNALLFCEHLSAMIGLEARLPSEAEWEYAARAGTGTRWFFGDEPSKLGEYAWFNGNAGGKSHPVGRKKPNPWGLHDIYGNVAEFVRDEHSEDYYANSPGIDPAGPLLGTHSEMDYTIEVPKAGTYTLTAKVATSNVGQSLQLSVNEDKSPTTIALPFTIGLWAESEPVTLNLRQGKNILHFWRDQAPQFGVALKFFILMPPGKN